jgi:hypothetical protein
VASKKRLMISATVVSAALGMAAAPASQASVVPAPCIGEPPPFRDPGFHPAPTHIFVAPFSDPKFFEGRFPSPSCLHPEPNCTKPPPGIEPV